MQPQPGQFEGGLLLVAVSTVAPGFSNSKANRITISSHQYEDGGSI
jgi:hypothetical protein